MRPVVRLPKASSLLRPLAMVVLATLLTACAGSPAPPSGGPAPGEATKPPTGAATSQPSAAATGAAAPREDTLVIVLRSHQGTLDPHFAATTQEMLITRNVYSALLKYKPNSTELTGDLATSWEVSSDGLVYTFHLRRDVEWHKGFGHFTAHDVKASFDRLRDPQTKSPFAGSISMLQEVQVVDDYTVKMVLREPYAPFPHLLTNYRAGPIVNVKAVRQFGENFAWNPIGTGPYQFESGVPKSEAIITAFDKYYGGRPPIKRIVTRTVTDLNAQVIGLESGEYDMIYEAPEDPAVIKRLQDRGFVVSQFSRNLPRVLLMNVTVEPFNNLKVRQAIAHAIDREQFVALAMPGFGKPWYSPVPEGFFAVTTDLPRYEHDVAKAKALLAEAGYPNGLDITMQVFDNMKLASDVIAEQLKQAGIRVKQEVMDQPTFISRVIQNQGINFAVHCCVRQPDPDIILSDMFSPKFRGAIYISHADLEAELAAARREVDVKKREHMYVELQRKIMEEVLMIPLAMEQSRSIHVASLKGMPTVEPLWGLDLSRLSFE